jgi:hypothetical protein
MRRMREGKVVKRLGINLNAIEKIRPSMEDCDSGIRLT